MLCSYKDIIDNLLFYDVDKLIKKTRSVIFNIL